MLPDLVFAIYWVDAGKDWILINCGKLAERPARVWQDRVVPCVFTHIINDSPSALCFISNWVAPPDLTEARHLIGKDLLALVVV